VRSEAEVKARLDEYRAVYADYMQDLKDIRSDRQLPKSQKKKELNIVLNLMKPLRPMIATLAWVMGEEEDEEESESEA
jgi:hypothetical protein